ncbi:MAG: D-alanine--D-alanine ligase [Thermovirgaceae bacterium]|nr:D-alanine--D-alanine ligase [Thermovirgaceae bacterium]
MRTKNRMKVAVLFGGDSPEREVSLSSGRAICSALSEAGVGVEPISVEKPREMLDAVGRSNADVFFIALHGGWGEGGRLQAALEMMGKAYTGSGPTPCAIAMDKRASKAMFVMDGVPTPRAIYLNAEKESDESMIMRSLEALDRWGKAVVKPCCCGSTVGVTIADSADRIRDAVMNAAEFDSSVIVEEYIPGREITVTVWEEDGKAIALPVIQIVPRSGFYTYEAKYTAGKTDYLCPAPLSPEETSRVCDASVAAHRLLGCSVYSRVDLRLTDEGLPLVLEVNTAPGMTATSLVPKSAAAKGWGFPELALRIAESSLALGEGRGEAKRVRRAAR